MTPGDAQPTLIQAARDALDRAMAADARVVVLGEDVGAGGPFGLTKGLEDTFGRGRVRNTPISEGAVMGVAIGMALGGAHPFVDLMFCDFVTAASDQLFNHAAKIHFMSGGTYSVPLTVWTIGGAGTRWGAQHSQRLDAWIAQVPGLKVLAPASPAAAAAAVQAALDDPDPVVLVVDRALLYSRAPLPADDGDVWRSRVVRRGDELTVAASGRLVHLALAAADATGVAAEIVDVQRLAPLDLQPVVDSVSRTSKLMVLHDEAGPGAMASMIAARVYDAVFWQLDAPILRLTSPSTPVPASASLEDAYVVDVDSISLAMKQLARGMTPRTPSPTDPEHLLELMLRSRRFDECLMQHADDINGHYHVSVGLEATGAALGLVWRPGDLVTTTYRNHAHLAALGMDLAVMFAEIFHRDLGPQRGRAGGTHISDPEHGVLHTSAMVSGGVPIALGFAFGPRSTPDAVCFCFFGDGAFGEGAVHESLNLASLWNLPVVFVCENNAGAVDDRANALQSAASLLAIAEVHRVPGLVADARRPAVVVEALTRLTDEVRGGGGPRFLDAQSPAWPGNSTFFPHDATGPTDLGEAQRSSADSWASDDDPVLDEARRLLDDGIALDELLELDARVTKVVDAAVATALDAPVPPADAATTGVYR